MKKYQIEVPYIVWVTTIVETDDIDDAVENLGDGTQPVNVVGNGGDDRMIAIHAQNTSIRACEEPHVLGNIDIEVTEIK